MLTQLALQPNRLSCTYKLNSRGLSKWDSDDFGMSAEELLYRNNIRRHVVSVRNLRKGEKIGMGDVCLKRSHKEDAVTKIGAVCGMRAKRDIKKNEPLLFSDLEKV